MKILQLMESGLGKGYVGKSMSVNAVNAYSNDEMPLSKWTKKEILNNLFLYMDDDELKNCLKSLTLKELRDTFLVSSGWHHTGALYNVTYFYRIDEDAIDNFSKDDFTYIINNRVKKVDFDKSNSNKNKKLLNDIFNVLSMMFPLTDYKSGASFVNKYDKYSLDELKEEFDKLINKKMNEIEPKYNKNIKQWEKLPENHYRKKDVILWDKDKDEYLKSIILEYCKEHKLSTRYKKYLSSYNR